MKQNLTGILITAVSDDLPYSQIIKQSISEDATYNLTVYDSDGYAADISGAVIVLSLKYTAEDTSPLVSRIATISNGPAGLAYFEIGQIDTSKLASGVYLYDVSYVSTEGGRYYIIPESDFNLTPAIGLPGDEVDSFQPETIIGYGLPGFAGESGKVLSNDGSDLQWVANGSGVTSVGTTARLTGGPITATGTLDLAVSGVTAASYGTASSVPTLAVDAYGRTTSAVNTPIQIAEAAVTGLVSDLASKISGTRRVDTTSRLTGGGALSSDLTLDLAVSGVTAGTYQGIFIDAYGRATSAGDPSSITITSNSHTLSLYHTDVNACIDAANGATHLRIGTFSTIAGIEIGHVSNITATHLYGGLVVIEAGTSGGMDIVSGGERLLALWGTIPLLKVTEEATHRLYIGGRIDSELIFSSQDVLGTIIGAHSIYPEPAIDGYVGVNLGIAAGDATSGNKNGGTLALNAGVKSGSGTNGEVHLGTASTSVVAIGGASTNISVAGPVTTAFTISDSSPLSTTMFDVKTSTSVHLIKADTALNHGVYLSSYTGNGTITVDDVTGTYLNYAGKSLTVDNGGVHYVGQLDSTNNTSNATLLDLISNSVHLVTIANTAGTTIRLRSQNGNGILGVDDGVGARLTYGSATLTTDSAGTHVSTLLDPTADGTIALGSQTKRWSNASAITVQIGTATAKPTAAVGNRGQLYIVQGGSGVADVLFVSIKQADDNYAWKTVTIS